MGTATYSYVQALKSALPAQYSTGLQDLPSMVLHLIDTALRFTSGGECPEDAELQTKESWKAGQDVVRKAFDGMKVVATANGSNKRSRDSELENEDHAAKKSKMLDASGEGTSSLLLEEKDSPVYALHALSLQAPLRKKLDIVIYKHTLRLINPSSQAVEASIPLRSLKRAFLLNTRGKTKAHWTVVILASDTVAPKPTGKAAQAAAAAAAASGEEKPEERQIVFGVDAAPPAYAITDHTASEASRTAHPKGTPVLPQLRAFLSHLPIPYVQPDTAIFRSVAPGSDGEPIAGVEGYRAAKEGTLWFLDDGMLWDGRPCEYWSVTDLVPGTSGDEHGSDAVRFVSATGKTGSVFIRRRVPRPAKDEPDAGHEEEDEEEEGEYVETSLNPVDAKEKDAIVRWVKKRKHLFGVDPAQTGDTGGTSSGSKGKGQAVGSGEKVDVKGKGKAVAPPEEDSDDSDDEDFVADSDSDDDGSASSSDSDESDGDASDAAEESGSEAGQEGAMDEDEDEEEDMDPKHHPLLRAGAFPRMSKAAMNMAVGMVNEDLLGAGNSSGSGGGGRKRAGGSSKRQKSETEEDEVESEEDELDD